MRREDSRHANGIVIVRLRAQSAKAGYAGGELAGLAGGALLGSRAGM